MRLLIVSLAFAVSAGAQQVACLPGSRPRPWFGWDGTDCFDCVITGSFIEYHREPSIRYIDPRGPAAGKLMEKDTLVSVDGIAITHPNAWDLLHAAAPGDSVTFVVRRATGLATVKVAPVSRCVARR